MKKLLFVVLVLLFGALMFAAGTLAPTSIKAGVERAANRIPGVAPSATKAAAPLSGQAAAPAAKAASDIPEVDAQALNLPAPLPDKADYALLAGQFSTADPAQALAAAARDARLAVALFESVETDGTRWFVVAVGKYGDVDAARTARQPIARTLNLDGALPVIMLPAPAKKA
ncbi:SPOR domain-containing protein [Chitinolyticbacter albus]|uniref:SPOR domain-containing protein n=1 Tax=Chitinolyticbacter albus TaxID=2961951 RepID=UPI00210C43EB|nr:SPOR domain-containing protein [Chitinolyticbacter albus]